MTSLLEPRCGDDVTLLHLTLLLFLQPQRVLEGCGLAIQQ